jgi:hypothetical protein
MTGPIRKVTGTGNPPWALKRITPPGRRKPDVLLDDSHQPGRTDSLCPSRYGDSAVISCSAPGDERSSSQKRRPACTYAHTDRLFVQMYERTPPASAGLHPSGFSTQPSLSSELCVVVSGACQPHLEHVDRVVVISKPSLTSEVEVAVLSVVQEDVPLLGVDCHVDAD